MYCMYRRRQNESTYYPRVHTHQVLVKQVLCNIILHCLFSSYRIRQYVCTIFTGHAIHLYRSSMWQCTYVRGLIDRVSCTHYCLIGLGLAYCVGQNIQFVQGMTPITANARAYTVQTQCCTLADVLPPMKVWNTFIHCAIISPDNSVRYSLTVHPPTQSTFVRVSALFYLFSKEVSVSTFR